MLVRSLITACILCSAALASEPVALGGPWTDGWTMAADGDWQGTGHPDPEELKGVPDAAMLAMASRPMDASTDRLHALVSIGRRRAGGAVEVLAGALQPVEPVEVRETAVAALIEHGGPEAVAVLRRAMLHDPSHFVRGNSVWALCSWGHAEARLAVEAGLEDPHPYVRGMAVLAVRALPPVKSDVLPILVRAAQAEHQLEWQEGLTLLADAGWPEAGAALRDLATVSGSKDDPRTQAALHAYRRWLRTHPELHPTD